MTEWEFEYLDSLVGHAEVTGAFSDGRHASGIQVITIIL